MPKKMRGSQKKIVKKPRKNSAAIKNDKTQKIKKSSKIVKKTTKVVTSTKEVSPLKARKTTRVAKTVKSSKTPVKVRRTKKPKSSVQVYPVPKARSVIYAIGSFFRGAFRDLIYPFYYLLRYHFVATFFSLLTTGLILGGAYTVYDVAFRDLPTVNQITQRRQPLTTKILDRNGKVLYNIYKDENRTLVPLSKVPQALRLATISIEDRDFYSHHGLSFRGIARALKVNSDGNHLQGGSTITQQLVKLTLLTPEKTIKRKIREAMLSFLVEKTYTKDEILEMYLNQVPYGGSTYGIEEAAQRYFGKSAKSLGLAESAFLAGLPQSPSLYSPFGNSPELAYGRQREVLRRMVEDQYITQEQADRAKQEELVFQPNVTNIQAPHFVMYIKDLLAEQYGEDLVNQGGLEVRTTIDLDLQNETQDLVSKEMATLEKLKISNGAALVTNPKTGEILAMVGSKNYFDFAHDGQVNVTMRPRQPGSSIKPLTYAIAFERGMMPSTTVLDEPITFQITGAPSYSPKNYDGRFHGTVTLREALGSSYNVPAVKTLASIGIENMLDQAEAMGITTWQDRNRFGLSLTLGGGEVLMTDMAKMYGAFANSGLTTDLSGILEVKTAKGEVLYHNFCALDGKECRSQQTVSRKTAYQITDILSDNAARAAGFGLNSVLDIPGHQVAVKTGTTNNLRDNWAIGYTQDRVVAVWVGNNDNTPMSYVASGITGASPIWNKVIRLTLDDENPHQFTLPEGMVKVRVCANTRTLPCAGCPIVREELFEVGTEPTVACNPNQFPAASTQPLNNRVPRVPTVFPVRPSPRPTAPAAPRRTVPLR